MSPSRLFVYVLLLLTLPHVAAAQDALVLSGGGSRGLAHAGALQGLEEFGLDPELVVGTSMGALVGALYAAGYTPDEIRERVLAVDWDDIFAPTPLVLGPDRAVRYPMVTSDLHVERLRIARGFVGQWRINRELARLLFDANARARGDFDRLPRRYRAVAADLKTGDEVVLAEGDLARATRASMSVPGAFAPVVWGEQVLVDGGIANNFPVDVARRLGAKRVVAVDVARPPEEIHSQAPLDVLSRAIDLMQGNAQRGLPPPDVLVLPSIDPSFSGVAFPSDPTPLFEIGLQAARRDFGEFTPAPAPGVRRSATPPDSLHELLIEAPDSALAALARRHFEDAAPGAYDADAVLTAMDRLYTTGLFEAIWPRVVEHPDTARSAPVLLVRLDSPPRTSLTAAAGFDHDRGARVWGSLSRYSRFGSLPLELTATLSLEGLERWAAASARVYALNRPALAWSVGAYARDRDVRIFSGEAISDADVLRTGLWAALEFPHILRDRVATAALRGEWIDEESGREGISAGPLLRYAAVAPNIRVVGAPLLLEAEARWGSIGYSRLAARGSRTVESRGLLLAGMADLRLTSSAAPPDVLPALGDEHAVPGLLWGEERGRTRLIAGADAAYPFMGIFVRLRLRTGAVSDRLEIAESDDWLTGAQLAIVLRNPLASLEWGFGTNTRGDRRFDLAVGRHF